MHQKTVDLVATAALIQQFFPGAREPSPSAKPGIMSAPFPITPENCKTKLGSWLATHIMSTRFDDDASRCIIVLPVTEMGLRMRELGEHVMKQQELATPAAAARVYAEIEQWLEKQKRVAAAYEGDLFRYRVTQFAWPVFGAGVVAHATTPEAYFDLCGMLLRKTDGVILRAGLENVSLPESLARTMATKAGGGLALLARHQKALAPA